MSQECLMSGCQRKFSMENCKKESAHKVAKRNATKTPLKPRLRISIFQLSPGNRLLRIEQSGVASSTKVPPNLKKRESVKLKGRVKKGKQEPKNHHQSQHSPNSHALFATDSLELKFTRFTQSRRTNYVQIDPGPLFGRRRRTINWFRIDRQYQISLLLFLDWCSKSLLIPMDLN